MGKALHPSMKVAVIGNATFRTMYYDLCTKGITSILTCFLCLRSPLSSRTIADGSISIDGTTASTVGTDPRFKMLRWGGLSSVSSPKDSLHSKQKGAKWAEQTAENCVGAKSARCHLIDRVHILLTLSSLGKTCMDMPGV